MNKEILKLQVFQFFIIIISLILILILLLFSIYGLGGTIDSYQENFNIESILGFIFSILGIYLILMGNKKFDKYIKDKKERNL